MNSIDIFLELLKTRLEQGAQDYGDQSFVRPIEQTVREIDQELADLPGWLYVLWCQASRKGEFTRDQKALRPTYVENLRRRMHRNDRGRRSDVPNAGILSCMDDIEILAMDAFEFAEHFRRRLQPIARAIEVAQSLSFRPTQHRGRRGGERDPRSDD